MRKILCLHNTWCAVLGSTWEWAFVVSFCVWPSKLQNFESNQVFWVFLKQSRFVELRQKIGAVFLPQPKPLRLPGGRRGFWGAGFWKWRLKSQFGSDRVNAELCRLPSERWLPTVPPGPKSRLKHRSASSRKSCQIESVPASLSVFSGCQADLFSFHSEPLDSISFSF